MEELIPNETKDKVMPTDLSETDITNMSDG